MIWVLGSLNIDLVATVARLPQPGETVAAPEMATTPGGKGANQALAARRAGAAVRMIGAVGTDGFAAGATTCLAEAGVDLSQLRQVPGPTGTALILREQAGENIIAVVPGANAAVDPAMAETALAALAPGDFLLLQMELPAATVAAALQLCRARGATSLLNIAPFTEAETIRALAAQADWVIGNETEFAALVGCAATGPARLEALRAHCAATGLRFVLTLGGAGAVACVDARLDHVDALAIRPVDTVGAGDTFCGYLAAALSEGRPLPEALRLAAVAGSLACLHPGAQTAMPLRAEVDAAQTKG